MLFSGLLALAFIFMVSIPVLANDIDIEQIGADNEKYAEQVGTLLDIDVIQTGTTANDVTITQVGMHHNVIINQTAVSGFNDGSIVQSDDDMDLTAIQKAGTDNDLNVTQNGTDSAITINQTAAAGYNAASVIRGGTAAGGETAVTQIAGTDNDLTIIQDISSTDLYYIGLSQNAGAANSATIANQDPPGSDPSLLTLVNALGDIGTFGEMATQVSDTGNNIFNWTAGGGDNTFGLYQGGCGDNSASVIQTLGGNTLAVYQYAPAGTNTLTVEQADGMNATIIQNATGGNNMATVKQY